MIDERDFVTKVPCGSCTICCQTAFIVLDPENGDDPSEYEVTEDFVLRTKSDGSCIYLGDNGCKIYERRPFLCKFYDCRKHYMQKLRNGKPQTPATMHGAEMIARGIIE